ncbi:DUF4124 domain-containing protein [Pseudoxanthomonas sp. 10H]|uniref:DUF4124 domain-containing protein n=1 Tax=Pseudoxanthomonas sp. 10H TaxID=3242729 RepID=UPI0035592A3E
MATQVAAQGTTIYRCTDAAGVLTVQNAPCPAGSTQREQAVRDLPSSPGQAPAPATAPPGVGPAGAPAAAAPDAPAAPATRTAQDEFVTTSTGPEPRILDSANLPRTRQADAVADPDRPPPPPLFRCATYDNDSYLSEDQDVPPRCLPLRTVGLDGNPSGGAGRACEIVRDQCARVPDGAACEAWRRYAREAETRFRFAHPDNVERRRTEYERLAGIVTASCGG